VKVFIGTKRGEKKKGRVWEKKRKQEETKNKREAEYEQKKRREKEKKRKTQRTGVHLFDCERL